MIRDGLSRSCLDSANRHAQWRNTRRSVKQRLRAAMPLYYRKGAFIEDRPLLTAETVNRTNANRRSEHRHG